ncbi:hypothetical protein OH492_09285 [Vibrio chagasii]|nr:hypothetical protein [Vibrio chagasii]
MLIGSGTVLTNETGLTHLSKLVLISSLARFQPSYGSILHRQRCCNRTVFNNPSLVGKPLEMGLRTLKFFPAEPSGGTGMLKSTLTAVYPVKFMPTGWRELEECRRIPIYPSVLACGGTWMVPTNLIDEGKMGPGQTGT